MADFHNFYKGDAALAFLDAPWSLLFVALIWLLHPLLGALVTLRAVILMAVTLVNDRLTHR